LELLLNGFHSQLEMIPSRKPSTKNIYLCSAQTIDQLPAQIEATSKHFGLLLAFNSDSIKAEEIEQVATMLVDKGLAYLCAWGPNCERVHDLFDAAAASKNEDLIGDDVIMTTWHADEDLHEALWFFLHSAFPTQFFETSCTNWVIAVIGNRKWEDEIRSKIKEIASSPSSTWSENAE